MSSFASLTIFFNGNTMDLMKKKEITIEDLVMMVKRGFNETAKKADLDNPIIEVENLSKSVNKKLDKIEKIVVLDHDHRIKKLEDDMKEVKSVLAIKD